MKRVYCICYIESKYFNTIESDLRDYGYNDIKAIIPTVKILMKNSRGKLLYKKVPILFNYGFIKMPVEKAYNRSFLRELKAKIQGIRGWLKSPESLHKKKKRVRIDNADIFDDFSIVATATREEVKRFKRLARENKRFSVDNILNIKIGDYIVLKGYPYNGIDANVIDVNHVTKTVKLLLYPEYGRMEINLPFDMVIYSVYENYNPEELLVNKAVDINTVTESAISKVLDINE